MLTYALHLKKKTFPIFENLLKKFGTATWQFARTSSPSFKPRLVSYPLEETLLKFMLKSFITVFIR